MSTIAEKLTYLAETKTEIGNAIVEKGQSISSSDTFRSYADKIRAISSSYSSGTKSITKNGTYDASDDGYDGYSSVTVNVSKGSGSGSGDDDESSITVEALNVTENGTYTADEGKAYSPVTVNVVAEDPIKWGTDLPATAAENIAEGASVYVTGAEQAGLKEVEGVTLPYSQSMTYSQDGRYIYVVNSSVVQYYDTNNGFSELKNTRLPTNSWYLIGDPVGGIGVVKTTGSEWYFFDLNSPEGDALFSITTNYSISNKDLAKRMGDDLVILGDGYFYIVNLTTKTLVYKYFSYGLSVGFSYDNKIIAISGRTIFIYDLTATIASNTDIPSEYNIPTKGSRAVTNGKYVLVKPYDGRSTWVKVDITTNPYTYTEVTGMPSDLYLEPLGVSKVDVTGQLAILTHTVAPHVAYYYRFDTDEIQPFPTKNVSTPVTVLSNRWLIAKGGIVEITGGGVRAYNANNKIHGTDMLGYAKQAINYGENGTVRVLFT